MSQLKGKGKGKKGKKGSKTLLSLLGIGNFIFSPTLSVMILQMTKNPNLRFLGDVHIQVRYKILQLEVPKTILISLHSPCFQ
jgi:hypothetical protein